MNFDLIYAKFQSRVARPEGIYKEFAVLAPLIKVDNDLHLLFEVRSEELNTQPGEICFPGGGIENTETPKEAAIRETYEELHIPKHHIEIIGDLDYIITPFNLILYPYLGFLKDIDFNHINYSTDEVGGIFTVPLDYFIKNEPESHYVTTLLDVPGNFPYEKIEGGKNHKWRTGGYSIFFYEYNGHIIWGMTAKIVRNIVNILKK